MEKNKIFKKFQSFQNLKISNTSTEKNIHQKIKKTFEDNSKQLDNFFSVSHQKILGKVLEDLYTDKGNNNAIKFTLKKIP